MDKAKIQAVARRAVDKIFFFCVCTGGGVERPGGFKQGSFHPARLTPVSAALFQNVEAAAGDLYRCPAAVERATSFRLRSLAATLFLDNLGAGKRASFAYLEVRRHEGR